MGPKPQNKLLCKYNLGNGVKCTKLKQYQSVDNIYCYCKKHYLSWKNNGGAPQTLDVNKNPPVDITGNNDATGQSSANTQLLIMLPLPHKQALLRQLRASALAMHLQGIMSKNPLWLEHPLNYLWKISSPTIMIPMLMNPQGMMR